MNEFLPLAKKYRPINFFQVIGQASIINTLRNAVITHQISNAYLFSGPRGSGKTTCARIFAKTINCLNLTNGEACNDCINCINFINKQSFNIIELDAASNNSVQDIRNIIDKAQYKPESGNYKIYILDEAHMLSQQALNAFLKILEEPPKHIIFILATTEKQKIIPTVISRCQVFNFHRLTINEISTQLKIIADKENILVDSKSIDIIAHKADGALRDALMIFDQISLSLNKKVSYKDVLEKLNIIDSSYFVSLLEHIIKQDIVAIINLYNQILSNGLNAEDIIIGLINYLRTLLLYKSNNFIDNHNNYDLNKLIGHKNNINEKFLIDALLLSNAALETYSKSKNISLHTELYLLNLYDLYKKLNDTKLNCQTNVPVAESTEIKFQQNHKNTSLNNLPVLNASITGKTSIIDKEEPNKNTTNDIASRALISHNNIEAPSISILKKLKEKFTDPEMVSILKHLNIETSDDKIEIVTKYKITKENYNKLYNYTSQNFNYKNITIYTKTAKNKHKEFESIEYTEDDKIEYFKKKYSDKKDNLSKFINDLKLIPIKV